MPGGSRGLFDTGPRKCRYLVGSRPAGAQLSDGFSWKFRDSYRP